jgi:hypothetical protein
MLKNLYNFWNWRTGDKVSPQASVLSSTFVSNVNLSKDYSDKKYYRLHNKIRIFEPMTNTEILYLNELSQENLIDIIKIYNNHSKNMKEYFENSGVGFENLCY